MPLGSTHAYFATILMASLWALFNGGWRIGGGVLTWVAGPPVSVGAHVPADIVSSSVIAVPIVSPFGAQWMRI